MADEDETNNEGIAAKERVRDARWTRNATYIFACVGVLGILLYASQFLCAPSSKLAVTLDVVGRGVLIACSSFLAGVLIGFIFGIPRALQTQSPSQAASDNAPVYHVNTNLEQISDWLTKIIVGVSLVELGKVPGLLKALGQYLSACLGEVCKSPSIAVVLVVLFFVLGFLAGYLLTRLYLTGAFRRAETPEQEPVNLDGLGPDAVVDA